MTKKRAGTSVAGVDVLRILQETVQRYPRAWGRAHLTGDPERYDFIILATKALYDATGGAVRGNWRRGTHGDLSADGISYYVDGWWYFADVIRKAKDHPSDPWEPEVTFHYDPSDANKLRGGNGEYVGESGAADPRQLRTHYPYTEQPIPPVEPPQPPQGQPCPDPSRHQKPDCPRPSDHVKPPYAGDQANVEFGRVYLADMRRAGQDANEGSWIWAGRVFYDHYVGGMPLADAIRKQREHPTDGWLAAMGLR